jgi:type I restriction enzyme, S subunit
MRLETFFEKFDLIAEAPDTIDRLRELVLELAMQGRLVEQLATEGDGHSLLAAVRQAHASDGLGDIDDVDPEELLTCPTSWARSRLGEVVEIVRGVSFPASAKSDTESEGAVACLRTANVQAEIDWSDLIFIPQAQVGRDDQWVRENDVVISMANSYALVGKVAIVRHVPREATFGAFLAAIRPILIEPYFLLYALRSPRMQQAFRVSSSQTTNIANISLGRMRPMPFPLPPLAEQKRIVAKVDELMVLCDRLEAQQQERQTRHAALARASLARFAGAPTPANLDFLFHDNYNSEPAELRKTILTLAVQGKLVSQHPHDEPAERFLASLVGRRRSSSGRVTSEKAAGLDGEEPFNLPVGWAWARFPDIGEFGRGKSKHRPRNDRSLFVGGTHRLVQTGDVARANGTIRTHTGLYNDIGLAQSKMWPAGTLCITIAANIADSGILELDACFPDSIVGFVPADAFPSVRYFEYFMRTAKDDLEKFAPSTAQKNINLAILEQVRIPIPPLAEQRRIIAKVDQLLTLVDQLEAQLATALVSSAAVLEAAIHELLNPTAQIISFPSVPRSPSLDRAAIGCYAIQQLGDKRTFGRTAEVKVLYLAEVHLRLDLGGRYTRDAAGPLDQWVYKFEEEAARQQWFSVVESATKDGHKKIEYRKGPSLSAKAQEAAVELSVEQRREFDRLLGLLAQKPTVEVEIIATLFAAWNDILIDGRAPSDDEIVQEVRENWHPSKQRFTQAELKIWLAWLRQHALVPQGKGPHTVGQQGKLQLH